MLVQVKIMTVTAKGVLREIVRDGQTQDLYRTDPPGSQMILRGMGGVNSWTSGLSYWWLVVNTNIQNSKTGVKGGWKPIIPFRQLCLRCL